MEAVRANHQVGLARESVIEANPHARSRLLDTRDGVAEDRLDRPSQRTIDRRRKVRAPQGDVAAVGQAGQGIDRHARTRAALSVHEAQLPHLVTQLLESGDQAHLFGDVVADQPEVDDVTAGAKLGRRLDEHHLVTGFPQPVSERRTRDARPVDDKPHECLGPPNG
jgi:hypothetical protein